MRNKFNLHLHAGEEGVCTTFSCGRRGGGERGGKDSCNSHPLNASNHGLKTKNYFLVLVSKETDTRYKEDEPNNL